MDLSDRSCVLGLYSYGRPAPHPEVYREFHTLVVSTLQGCGVSPTYAGVQGAGFSGKYVRAGNQRYREVVEGGFQGISGLTLLVNPRESRSPTYDSFIMVSLAYIEANDELLLCWLVNERFIELEDPRFEEAIDSFAGLADWDFGYAFSDQSDRQPELHVLGLDSGHLSRSEHDELNAWYSTSPANRVLRIRGVYRRNMLNERQLSAEVGGGVLRDFITHDASCSLRQLRAGLYEWAISDDGAVRRISEELAGSSALIGCPSS